MVSETPLGDYLVGVRTRALAYLPDEPDKAIASIVLDLAEHEKTKATAVRVGLNLAVALNKHDNIGDLRRAIETLQPPLCQ
jgi:hypothetical protein